MGSHRAPSSSGRRRAPRAAAAGGPAEAAPKASDAGAVAMHEELLGETLAQAKAALAKDGIDARAEGASVKARAEASWGGLPSSNARAERHAMERRPEPEPQEDFGAFWEPLVEDARASGDAVLRGHSAGFVLACACGPRLSAFGLAADETLLIDTLRRPAPGDAVLIWAGDGRRVIVLLREPAAARRFDSTPLGPDDVDDLSGTRALGFVARGAPGS